MGVVSVELSSARHAQSAITGPHGATLPLALELQCRNAAHTREVLIRVRSSSRSRGMTNRTSRGSRSAHVVATGTSMPWNRMRSDPILSVSPSVTDATPEMPAPAAPAATRTRGR